MQRNPRIEFWKKAQKVNNYDYSNQIMHFLGPQNMERLERPSFDDDEADSLRSLASDDKNEDLLDQLERNDVKLKGKQTIN